MKSKELVGLTPNHIAFIGFVMEGTPLDIAAKKAGFSTPARDAYPCLLEPEVLRVFRRMVSSKAGTEGLSVCYNYFIEVIRDTNRPDKQRLDAAKFLYAHHMPAAKAQEVATTEVKSVSDMNNQELEGFITHLETEFKNRLASAQGVDSML